jgi:hypothetical protein
MGMFTYFRAGPIGLHDVFSIGLTGTDSNKLFGLWELSRAHGNGTQVVKKFQLSTMAHDFKFHKITIKIFVFS